MSGVEGSKLPEGWAWVRLDQICEINPRDWDTPGSLEEQISFIPMAAVEAETGTVDASQERPWGELERKSYTKFHEGDILFAKVTPCMENGKIAVASGLHNGRGVGSAEFHVLRPSKEISRHYLLFYLLQKSFRSKAERSMSGAVGLRRVPANFLKEHSFPLPPLAEQHRIVEAVEAYLSRLDAGVASMTLARAKAQRFISSLYGRAVSGGLSRAVRPDEVVDEAFIQEASRLQSTRRWKPVRCANMPGYTPPDNWTTVSLGTLSNASGYGTSTKCGYGAPGYPVLRIPNVQGGSIDLSDIKNAIDPTLDLTKFALDFGDLLFVRTNGSPSLIGRVGVVEEALPYAFASYLIRFRLTTNVVEPRWVQLVTQSPLWRRAIEKYAASSAGQYNLSAETLGQLPVPLPPLGVQRETLEAVDAAATGATRLSAVSDTLLSRSGSLRSGVLQRAFTGCLVAQDPADEPASVLIDRIRVERETRGGKPKRAVRRPRKAAATADTPPPPPAFSTPSPTTVVQQELPL
ncbi:restriction endonuclease subunit S [[Kitasatospora] papulosa]|uniref:restriction endonuclease subunit S n=1 Tax=[Kitasatospora] papulosa TaxID=1464011 RepID=UPI0036B9F662